MSLRVISLVIFVLQVSITESNTYFNEWKLADESIPYESARAFVVYCDSRKSIYGLGGSSCGSCGFVYNLETNTITNITTSATSSLRNGDVNNAILINDTYIYALSDYGDLWKYTIDTNDILIINSDLAGILSYACIVSDTLSNTYFFACDGRRSNNLCFKYSVDDDTWQSIPSV